MPRWAVGGEGGGAGAGLLHVVDGLEVAGEDAAPDGVVEAEAVAVADG